VGKAFVAIIVAILLILGFFSLADAGKKKKVKKLRVPHKKERKMDLFQLFTLPVMTSTNTLINGTITFYSAAHRPVRPY